MSLTNEKIKDEFLVWAQGNEDKSVFPTICREDQSYYVNRKSESTYLMEYSFKTLAELKNALESYSGLSEDLVMLKSIAIAICHERYRSKLDKTMKYPEKNIELDNDDKVLPEYIYAL